MKKNNYLPALFRAFQREPQSEVELPGLGRVPVYFASDDEEKRKVETERRRRTDSSSGRKQAGAPSRDKSKTTSSKPVSKPPSSSGGGTRPPSSGGGGYSGGAKPPMPGGSLPSGGGGGGRAMSPIMLIGILIVGAVCGIPALFLLGSFGGGDSAPAFDPSSSSGGFGSGQEQTETSITIDEDFVAPPPSTEGQTWLVMLYQDADDKILEQDIYVDLNEAERIGSNDRVYIVAQVDRYRGGYSADGDWTSTKRFYLEADPDLNRVHSRQIMDLGEVNMADGDTLVDFVQWADETFPADKHVLIMSDHGMGWPGGWSDPDTGGPRPKIDTSIPLANALGNQLYLNEIDEALTKIHATTSIQQFEIIGMDACLMGHLEVFTMLEPHSRYAVASQETEPAVGWAYTGFLDNLVNNPDMSGAELSQEIVRTYIDEDQRIVDDQARAEMVSRGGMFAPTQAQLSSQLNQASTLTAVDLALMPALNSALNNLVFELQGENQRQVAQARQYAQSYTSIFGNRVEPSYLDLSNFVEILTQQNRSQDVANAAVKVQEALDIAVIAEKHGPKKPGSNGISVYFPDSQLYRSPNAGPESYTAVANAFAENSLWDDFLAYHYTGREFDASSTNVAIPDRGAVVAPGAGTITVGPVITSSDVASPGNPITLSADVNGDNIAYIKIFTGFYDEASNAIFVADTDYLESGETREASGVYYPEWGEGDFTVEFTWEPIVFGITDGEVDPLVLLNPQEFGATFEDAIYTVDGIYTYTDGEQRSATVYFQNGQAIQVFGFLNDDGTGAPREILPTTGDTFTILETWLDLDDQGRVAAVATETGATLTFGSEAFRWEEFDAAPGNYVVGFIVEDLDGNATQSFKRVTVE